MEAFMLEFKEMKDCINQLKKDVESINQLKKDVESLTNMYNDNMEEMREVKKENIALQQQVQLLQREDDESKQSALSKQSMDSSNEDIIPLDKKVETRCSKVEKSVKIFKKQFEQGMTKIQEESCQLGRHQRVLSVLHVSLQDRNEVKNLKTEIAALKKAIPPQPERSMPPLLSPPTPAVSGTNPSKTALSTAEAKLRFEDIKKASSYVSVEKMTSFYNMPVIVGEYTKVETACDYMDPESGVYTVPLQGQYKLIIDFTTRSYYDDNFNVCLCTDSEDKRMEIKRKFGNYGRSIPPDPIVWCCEPNNKVWVEVIGTKQVQGEQVSDISFQVIKL